VVDPSKDRAIRARTNPVAILHVNDYAANVDTSRQDKSMIANVAIIAVFSVCYLLILFLIIK